MKITEWLNTEMLRVIGWSIIHSIWQFSIFFAALKALLLLISKNNSRLRYFVAIAFLTGAVVCSVFTFNREYKLLFGEQMQSLAGATNTVKSGTSVKFTAGTPYSVVLSPAATILDFLNGVSPYLTLGWIIGMILYLAKIVNGGFYLNSLRKLPGEEYPKVREKLKELSGKMQISKNIKLIINNAVFEPLTFGHLKPIILLPCGYIAKVPMEQLEMILAHELAHIKRYDYLVNLLQAALEAIYFYNPFFTAMSAIIRNEREFCCDDIAAETCGNKRTMAISLANLKVMISRPDLTLAAAPKKSVLFERIIRLTEPYSRPKSSLKNATFTFLLIAFTLLFLTKCVYDHSKNDKLPTTSDAIEQLLTDNQANYKEQLFVYEKAGQNHEIFLVSTVDGAPVYAYLDGERISQSQLKQITDVMKHKRNITMAEIQAFRQAESKKGIENSQEVRANQHSKIYVETDSLNKLIKQTEADLTTHYSANRQKQLQELKKQVDIRNRQEVALSMAEYRAEIKMIPVDVKLHVLLTKIIAQKEYTPDDRKELNDLARKRQGI
ncbi:MAG TPA: M56 family metallopeptidase [Mucilaginibacter sp.]|jgi:beta-lactamase regulating signal transducer with metallopeptidase domain